MNKSIITIAVVLAGLTATAAHADHPEIVFKGGLTVTDTVGCTPGYNPLNLYVEGFYFVPIPGSVNGPDSNLSFHAKNGAANGFRLSGGSFTSNYKAVNAFFVYTRAGSYSSFVKITKQVPAVLTTTSGAVTVAGSIKGFDFRANCTINFLLNAVRDSS